MSIWVKQSTAVTVPVGPFVDSTDGATAETALTISQADIRLSKNGGAFAQTGNVAGATHMENGWYGVPLNTTDTNTLGELVVNVNETGALQAWVRCMVVPANVWDSLFGADKLQVHVDEMTAGIITATVIATDAIDADAIAANAIDAGAIATGAITAAKFAAGAIDAAAIATGAIDADALAADAGAEIADAVWDEARAGHVAAGSFGEGVASVQGNVTGSVGSVTGAVGSVTGAVGSVTGNVGGNVVGSVGSVAAGGITAASIATGAVDADALAADAVAEIADGVWDEARVGHVAAGSFGEGVASVQGNVTGSVASVTGAVGSVTGSVGSVTGAVGSVTGNVGGNVVGSVASVTGAVGSVAAGGITAASIATNAVDADALATDAVTEIVNAVLTTAMTESYNADGAAPTVAQALMGIMQRVTEFSISGTTITVKKLDGTTAAMTLTLDSATTPTSSTRAT